MTILEAWACGFTLGIFVTTALGLAVALCAGKERRGSALRYRCEGGDGCVNPGCEFVAVGKPWTEDEKKVYTCPFNHWRSCRWVQQTAAGKERGK